MKFLTLILSSVIFTMPALAAPSAADFDKSMEQYISKDENVEKVAQALERFFQKKRGEQQQQAAKAEEDELEEQFKNPIKVDVGTSPVRGPANAKITVVEFSDFQCPFCARGKQTMDELAKAYPNDVKIAFKNLPLPFHPEAKPAAKAALAAGEQGKFWEMHDELFSRQNELGEAMYYDAAKKLGLNVDKFKADFTSTKFDAALDADAALAASLDVRGTPGFFVNGVRVRGARPMPYFKTIVDRWLNPAAAAAAKPAEPAKK